MDETSRALSTTTESLRGQIAEWRTTRTHRGAPMPAALWAAAIALARQHGLAATARALGVDYGTLKHRTAASGAGPVPATTFVDLGMARSAGLGACVIAVAGARGRRLRVEVSDLCVPDLVALVQAAWGSAR